MPHKDPAVRKAYFKLPHIQEQQRKYREEHREERAQASREWRAKNPDKFKTGLRRSQYKRKYGITLEHYQALVNAQDGRCKICDQRVNLVVDHDHETGGIRGLLCSPCNRGLGFFRDNVNRLSAASEYLRGFKAR